MQYRTIKTLKGKKIRYYAFTEQKKQHIQGGPKLLATTEFSLNRKENSTMLLDFTT